MEEYLKVKLNTPTLYGINVYELINYYKDPSSTEAVSPTWVFSKTIVTNVTSSASDPVWKFDRTTPRCGTAVDLEKVVVRTIKLRYIKSTCNVSVSLRIPYIHSAFKKTKDEQEALAKNMMAGQVIGFAMAQPGFDGAVDIYQQHVPPNFLPLNDAFLKSVPLFNERNIRNGILQIPYDDCIRLNLEMEPTVWDVSGSGSKTKIPPKAVQSYFCVPPDHALAWPLNMTFEQRLRHGIYTEDFYVMPPTPDLPDMLVFYLVPDVFFNQLYESCVTLWMNVTQPVPLNSLTMEYHPVAAPVTGDVKCTLSVVMYTVPSSLTPEYIDTMACVLPVDFPSFNESAVFRKQRESHKAEQDKIKSAVEFMEEEEDK